MSQDCHIKKFYCCLGDTSWKYLNTRLRIEKNELINYSMAFIVQNRFLCLVSTWNVSILWIHDFELFQNFWIRSTMLKNSLNPHWNTFPKKVNFSISKSRSKMKSFLWHHKFNLQKELKREKSHCGWPLSHRIRFSKKLFQFCLEAVSFVFLFFQLWNSTTWKCGFLNFYILNKRLLSLKWQIINFEVHKLKAGLIPM